MPNSTKFHSLALPEPLLTNLQSLGYNDMTPIQAASLPLILQQQDVVAQAKTGSGKTAAFGLGILAKINPRYFAIQGLVICPTRELADQVANELRRLARAIENIKILTLCGGTAMRPQIASLEHGAHIVVGTPGRLIDHISRATIDLSTVQTLVLDEADRMLDMGFFDDMLHIIEATSPRRQTLLFSATFAPDIERISQQFMRQAQRVQVEKQHSAQQINQYFYAIPAEERNAAVAQLVQHFRPTSTIAFCNTKIHCRELTEQLLSQGISALALHGDLEQRDRDEVLVRFANQSCSVLVATDVAARGLDIPALDAVINVDVCKDSEVHIHRIGRTGRAGQQGLALTLCSAGEKKWVKLIEQYQQQPAVWQSLAELNQVASTDAPLQAPMQMLQIMGGKKDKLRPGDILGALTANLGLAKDKVGKINVFEFVTYVAIDAQIAAATCQKLNQGNIKGRQFKVRLIE